MVKEKIKESDYLIEIYLRKLKTFFTEKWKNNDTVIEYLKGTRSVGSITFKDNGDANTEIIVEGELVIKELKKIMKLKIVIEKTKLTEAIVNKSVFKDGFGKKESYNGLMDNSILFEKIAKGIKATGIGLVRINHKITMKNSFSNKIILSIDSDIDGAQRIEHSNGFYNRLKDFIGTKLKYSIQKNEIYVGSHGLLRDLRGEKTINLKIKGMEVGKYYVERNFIQLFFNPFSLNRINPISTAIDEPIKELIKSLKEIKLKKKDINGLKKRIFVSSFLNDAEKKMTSLKNEMKTTEVNISSSEKSLCAYIRKFDEVQSQYIYIEKTLTNKGKGLYESVKETEKLPFIEKLEIGTDSVKLYFKPATIKVNSFIRTDHGTDYGRRTMYLGKYVIEVKSTGFTITNDMPETHGHPHPHCGIGGSPCFGSGEGHDKIYRLLSSNQFKDLAYMLWLWIKTYKNSGAYVKMWDMYDDRLKQGLPVWDDKGKRIEINDTHLIETEEQKQLTKSDSYDTNKNKFKGLKIF